MTSDILTCAVDRWTTIWGDPALSGTLFMLGYGVAATLVFWVARSATPGQRGLWWLCGVVLALLAANIHPDLHAFPGSLARCMAHAQGWYANRATVQMLALGGIVILFIAALLWVLIRYRAALRANPLLTGGMALTLGFTLLRGVGAIYSGFEAFYIAKTLETLGIVLCLLGALRQLRSAKAPQS